MRLYLLGATALLLASAAPAYADDAPAPTPEITVNGSATLTSDYRFRGISQTDKTVAVQGSITVTHTSGFYVTVWGSSVDSYVTAKFTGHQELDLIAGYKKTIGKVTLDGGVLYYVYPGAHLAGDTSSSNFFEPYFDISTTLGPVTAKATVNYAPKQKALGLCQGGCGDVAQDNVYVAGDFSAAIPETPLGLTAHIGHTFGPSWLSIGTEYTDWSLGATVTWKALTLGVSYVDTDGDFITPLTGRNAAKAGVVASLTAAF